MVKRAWALLLLCANVPVLADTPPAPPSLPQGAFGFELGTILAPSLRRGCGLGDWCRVLPRQRQPEFDRYSVRITPTHGRIYRIAASRFLNELDTCRTAADAQMNGLAREYGIQFEPVPATRLAPLVRAAWRWALPAPATWQGRREAAYEIEIRCKGPAIGINTGGVGRAGAGATLKIFFNDFRLLMAEDERL